jgi:hypothetical protein
MSTTTRIRIGLQMARELEFEVEDIDSVISQLESAMGKGDGPVWITDAKGHRHGIAAGKVAFVEVESDEKPGGVGFGSSS